MYTFFSRESISSVCVGWTKNVLGSAKCNYLKCKPQKALLEATFFLKIGQFLFNILHNFLISVQIYKIDVYDLACFF